MIIIALYNLKGGVGKTTSVVNLSYLSSSAGHQTVLWDWDPQAAASWYCGVEKGKNRAIKLFNKGESVGGMEIATPYENLTVIPADLSLRKVDAALADGAGSKRLLTKLVSPLGKTTDYLFFDCPPTLSPSIEYLLSGCDLVLVPVIPSPLSVRAMEQVLEFFDGKKSRPKTIMGFFTQVDLRRNLHKQMVKDLKKLPFPMLKTWIPIDSAAEQMGIRKAPLTSYAKEGRAAAAYIKLWREINRVIKKEGLA